MDYYEELGIEPSATPEEIHRAHRRLTKLLHPDQQSESSLKSLAETQMRRVNAIVQILTDPELRQQYDEQLMVTGFAPSGNGVARTGPDDDLDDRHAARARKTFLPWWVWIPVGAAVLTLGIVWFWSGDLGLRMRGRTYSEVSQTAESPKRVPGANNDPSTAHSSIASSSKDATTSQDSAETPAPEDSRPIPASPATPQDSKSAAATTPAVSGTATPPGKADDVGVVHQPTGLANLSARAVVNAAGRAFNPAEVPPPPDVATARSEEEAAIAAPAVPVRTPTAPDFHSPPVQNPLAGEWVYAPGQAERLKAGVYPARSIHLRLFWNGDGLYGDYVARYEVADPAISPDVNLALSPADRGSRKFSWQSSNGSRGTLKIKSVNPETIRVEWRTTIPSRQPTLTAGTATLVRRSP